MGEATSIVVQLVTALGPAGILAWFLYHTTKTTFPDMISNFREENAETRKESKKERDQHAADMKQMTDLCMSMVRTCQAGKIGPVDS